MKKTSSAFSSLLFWISSLYLTAMIFCTYLFLSFSSKLLYDGLTDSDLAYIIPLSVGSNAMIQTLVYINILSQDVTTNLHDLKDCISDIGTGTKRMVFSWIFFSINCGFGWMKLVSLFLKGCQHYHLNLSALDPSEKHMTIDFWIVHCMDVLSKKKSIRSSFGPSMGKFK